jgi:hypothetical protein
MQHLALDEGPGGANIVMGEIVHMHLDDMRARFHGLCGSVVTGFGWSSGRHRLLPHDRSV